MDAVLPGVPPAKQEFVGREHLVHRHVPPMDIGRVVLLASEDAVDHPDIALAVDEMGGVGRNADDPVRTGRGLYIEPKQFDVFGALGDDAHPAAVVQFDVDQVESVTVQKGEGRIVPIGRPESQNVADGAVSVVAPVETEATGAHFLGLGLLRPDPVVMDMIGHLLPGGIEFKEAGIGIGLAVLIQEEQVPLPESRLVMLGELHFEKALPHRRNHAFGHESTFEVNG